MAPAARRARQGKDVDRRVELGLGALACAVLLLIGFMVLFVFQQAWPSFANNGLSWFDAHGNVRDQIEAIYTSPADPSQYNYDIGAWPLLWGTAVVTGSAVLLATAISLLSSIFIVEFAPEWLSKVLQPVVRLLAAVPSVVYGLIGVLVLVPFVLEHFIDNQTKESVQLLVVLDGSSILVGITILTVMITPIMIAIITDALRNVPRNWTEGAAALGVNRWRAMRTVSVRAARPAIVAAAVLATARALGEAIMLSMVLGASSFAPNPLDGFTFFLEPARPLAAAIVQESEGLSVKPFAETIYAFAAVLLVSSAMLSFAGWAARQSFRKYTLEAR